MKKIGVLIGKHFIVPWFNWASP